MSDSVTGVLRSAVASDIEVMRGIEDRAGEPFDEVGMGAVAQDAPPTVDVLREFIDAGRAWVCEVDGVVVAYVVVGIVDGNAHLEQVSVDPAFAHRRIGKRLIDHAMRWAAGEGFATMTLTTFTEVAWNGPYYARIGFRTLPNPGPQLRAIRAAEVEHGLDQWPRECMGAHVAAWRFD
ncbi:GNAT family N-acetyltransferase [Nocardia camponoti]|uniref:GCN5 family N-acetyltransferase n=1 Tax=Nocardia camponoti TaxID=1616106 RepID=A0A917VD07_9NOCA|nr:GNAT family N-acetyltransferase [Nocardia camponoti]GGK64024.1 GCN5 family N-acetyltransferase [Nocardia camponoti]